MLSRTRNAQREWAEQNAFEEAERARAEKRASALFDSLVDSSPIAMEVFDTKGRPVRSNKAAERLLGKVPPPGISLFEERGLKRAGLLEPQLRRVLAGTKVETPPTWYDPTEIGLPGTPGARICFRATVFPLHDSEGKVGRIAVTYEDLTELCRLEQRLKGARSEPRIQETATQDRPQEPTVDIREVEYSKRKVEQALHEAGERHRAIIEGAKGYIACEIDDEGRFSYLSPSVESIWGISAAAILADNSLFFGQIHPDDRKAVMQTESAVRRQSTYPGLYRFRVVNKTTGKTAWVDTYGSVFSVSGKKVHYRVIVDVTQLVLVEQSLQEKTVAVETLLSGFHDGILLLDRDLAVSRWSPGAEKETGIPAAQAVGRHITELYPEFSSAGFVEAMRVSLSTLSPRRHEAFCPDTRREVAGWYELNVYPWGSGLLAFLRNTTITRNAERSLKQKQADIDSLLATRVDGLIELDKNLVVRSWNEVVEKETHIAADDAKGKPILAVYPGFEPAGFLKVLQDTLKNRIPYRHEAFCPDTRQDVVGWYELTAYPWNSGLLVFLRNVTQTRTAQRTLAQKQADLASLVNSTADGVIVLDRNLTVLSWNQAAEKETRITAAEARGKAITALYPSFAPAGFLAAVQDCLRNRNACRHEAFYEDGREKYAGWFSISVYPHDQGVLLFVRNTTQVHKTEQAWLLADAQLRALYNLTGLAVATKNADLCYTSANAEARRMLGLPADAALLGRSDREILKPAVADLLSSHDRKALTEAGPVELETVLPDALSPSARWFRVLKAPLQSSGSTKSGTLTVAIDITKRVQAGQELSRRKEFLEAVIREQSAALEKAKAELKRWTQ